MRIVGIDPGISGAIGVLGENCSLVEVFDMPTVLANKSSNRQMVNAYELAKRLRTHVVNAPAGVVAVVENVQAMPSIPGVNGERRGMGSASAFAFGKSYGIIVGALAALGVSLELVAPSRWKGYFQLTRDKDQARELAQRLWPQAELGLKRHHNRAESLLIARWYAQVHQRESDDSRPPF